MSPVSALLYPMLAMAGLSFTVAVRMYLSRVAEMKRRRIHPQKMATRTAAASLLEDTRAADNFKNLFELPVLFYAGVLTVWAAGFGDGLYLALAWLFVASRIVHSLVHLTYNRVMHRFTAFIAGFVILLAFWLKLAVDAVG